MMSGCPHVPAAAVDPTVDGRSGMWLGGQRRSSRCPMAVVTTYSGARGNRPSKRVLVSAVTALVVAGSASVCGSRAANAAVSTEGARTADAIHLADGAIVGKRRLPEIRVRVTGGYARLSWRKWQGWQYRTRWSQPDGSGFGRWESSSGSVVTRAVEPGSSYLVKVQGIRVRKGKIVESTYSTLVSYIVP